jgi:aryl-alcohol dehydrogenase-like predicted oxidoreductase
MEWRKLGSSERAISAIGLGCAGMSGGYGRPNESQSLHALAAAIDNGINFFDTADAYGGGHNEELLGRFVRRQRAKCVIATKFGLIGKPGQRNTVIDNSPEYVRRACDASLQRLGIDTIDLYYAQRRNQTVPIEELVGAMAELVTAGKVRYLGLTEVLPDTLRRACAVHPIAALQSEYSLWTREPEHEVLAACRALGVTFVAFCPLGRAFLTGAVQSIEGLDADDYRRMMPRFQQGSLESNLRLVRKLAAFSAELGATSAQVALSWLLAKHPHVVPIPGSKQPHHVLENVGATRLRLSAEQVAALDRLFPSSAIAGPRYPPAAMIGIEIAAAS